MRAPRRYDERCGVAHALDLVGQRWALLVIRELLLGPKRFGDLRACLPGAAPDVLSRRLRGLEQAVVALARWGATSPRLRPDAPVGADSLMLGVRTFFDQTQAPGLRGS